MFQNIDILNISKSNGLLLVSQKDDDSISETERKFLYTAKDDYLADAVFFHRIENQKSIPQFFVYDNTHTLNNKYEKISKEEIHKRLWSSQIVPIYFVYHADKIEIINARQKVDNVNENDEISVTETIEISKAIEKEYNAIKQLYSPYLFENGSFWDSETSLKKYLNDAITKESPLDILIENLQNLKLKLTDRNVKTEIANRIVVFCILIKYLEEKKDETGKSVFSVEGNIFQKKWKVKNFSDLVLQGKFIKLLNYLSQKFNGKIFELSTEEERAIKNFSPEILHQLSDFVNANYKAGNDNYFLWQLYSFRYLPVELISRIYEEFIPKQKGVVYTPPFLVDFLIDECMPLEEYKNFENGKFKIIDPACGSGIFCVSTYKRLIDWHIINEYKRTKNWNTQLDIETLKTILRENIFGVDKELQAVQVTVFSLTIALLEKLTPKQLWDDLDFDDKEDKKEKKFEDLKRRNIIHSDFFSYLKNADTDFALVIGNPPFIRGNFNEIKNEFCLEFPNNIPKNLAILFLDQSINLLKTNGLQCLILPSSAILYNEGAMNYRKQFMEKNYVPQIVDFTHLRRKLFGKDVATCAFFVKKQVPDTTSQTLHLISRNTAKEERKIYFNFDTYDFHFVPQKIALTQKYVWKANLVGGGRLKRIADRLSRVELNIKKFLDEKEEKSDWMYKRGYFLGSKKNTADYITDKYYIPEKSFTNKGIDYSQIKIEKELKFEKISSKKVFTIPQIIIKRVIANDGVIPIELIDYSEVLKNTTSRVITDNLLCFRHGIIGIHYNAIDKDTASQFLNYFKNTENNKLFSLFIYLSSGATLVRKEGTLEKIDIDNLPYPQTETDKENLQLSEVEKIWQDDVFNYYIHQAKVSKSNPLNAELFPNGIENNKDKKFILEYAETFTWLMNINYQRVKGKSFKTGKITITKSYIAVEFHYCKEDIKQRFEYKTEEEYQDYFEETTGNKKITRVVEFIDFHNNRIYYIKPHQKRYWLKSIADRDGMSCFADFGNNLI